MLWILWWKKLLHLIGDPRWLMIILPSLIGVLTVPGGAMMSAPIVDSLGNKTKISAEHKTGINIIYRHIWYIIFPMIPTMVLAASLANVNPIELGLVNLPIILVGLVAAWFLLLHNLPGKSKVSWNANHFSHFLLSISPILFTLVLYLVFDFLFFP